MDPMAFGLGFAVLAFLCSIAIIFSWQTRRMMIAVFGETPTRAQLGQRGWYVRPPDPPPGPSSPGPPGAPPASPPDASPAAPATAPPGSSRAGAATRAEGGDAAAPRHGRAADGDPAEDADSTPGAPEPATPSKPLPMRPPPLAREEPELPAESELRQAAPETTRKPGSAPFSRQRPAVIPRPDLTALRRDLDDADQAQADQAPAPRVPTTRPPPSSQQAPVASGAHASIAPPGSAPVLAPGPGITAAGLGPRPDGTRGGDPRPAPHPPPQPARRATLLGIPPPPATARPLPAVSAPPPRVHQPTQPSGTIAPVANASVDDSEPDDEPTRMAARPSPEALGLAPVAPGAQGAPPVRAIHATLASMPSVVPVAARPATTVAVIEAGAGAADDDDQRATLSPGAAVQ
jgi:hypothetical protein